MGLLGCFEIADVSKSAVLLNMRHERLISSAVGNSLEAGRVVPLLASIGTVLRFRGLAQIGSSVIELVLVDVIDALGCRKE